MECLGLHNKPKAEVHPGHKLTDPKEEEEEEDVAVLLRNSNMTTLASLSVVDINAFCIHFAPLLKDTD
jgi:hypothetical protein